mmetsp:Transcript_40825/g.102772  ORF Transcript_40825/g.102772 Transcript_40825/m.102772 type:complete len:217 (+) Transcript_40825:890-1540(+)
MLEEQHQIGRFGKVGFLPVGLEGTKILEPLLSHAAFIVHLLLLLDKLSDLLLELRRLHHDVGPWLNVSPRRSGTGGPHNVLDHFDWHLIGGKEAQRASSVHLGKKLLTLTDGKCCRKATVREGHMLKFTFGMCHLCGILLIGMLLVDGSQFGFHLQPGRVRFGQHFDDLLNEDEANQKSDDHRTNVPNRRLRTGAGLCNVLIECACTAEKAEHILL